MINLGNEGEIVIIAVGDPHVSGQNPISRVDEYPETILKKIDEIGELAEEIEADATLYLGDMFHTPDPSNTTKGELGAILQKRTGRKYTLAGNHDLYGGNFNSYKRTGLGLLEKLKTISILRDEKPLFFKKGNLKLQITSQNFHHYIDKRDPALDYVRKKAEGMTHSIHLAHGYLTDRKLLFSHTMVSDIWDDTEADLTLSGHFHTPFRVEHNGKIFANPGALGRMSASRADRRMPKVFIIRIKQDGTMTVEDYFLKTAKPYEEIIDGSHLEEDNDFAFKMSAFVEELTALSQDTDKVLDIYEIIQRVSEDEKIEPAVKEEVLRTVSEAEAEIQMIKEGSKNK